MKYVFIVYLSGITDVDYKCGQTFKKLTYNKTYMPYILGRREYHLIFD